MTPIFWDNRIDRIRRSGCPNIANSIYLGDHYFTQQPYLIPKKRRSPHIHVMGGSGGGKSALAAGYLAQCIANGWSVCVIDLKRDLLLRAAAQHECYHQGALFRCVDIRPGQRTHLFPFRQPYMNSQSFMAQAETLIQAFGLGSGSGKDGAYFSAMDEKLQYGSLVLRPEDVTPGQIAKQYADQMNFRPIVTDSEWKHTSMSRAVMTKLASVTAMNAVAGCPGVTRKVLDYAIDLRQLFYDPQVMYFSLDSGDQHATTQVLGGLVAYSIKAAAAAVPHVRPVEKVALMLDDCQDIVGGAHVAALVDTLRSYGVELCLLHQDPSQLRRGDFDLRTSLAESTGLHIVFAPTSGETRSDISNSSGTKIEHHLSWAQYAGPWLDPKQNEQFGPQYAVGSPIDLPKVGVSQQVVPIWNNDDIMRLSAVQNVAWIRLKFDEGIANYQGEWNPVLVPFHITAKEKEVREEFEIPLPEDETILVTAESDYDRSFQKDRPKESPPPTPKPADNPFADIRAKRREEGKGRKK